MPYDKEKRKAINKRYYDSIKGDPDFRKKEADRVYNAYWTDPEKKRKQNRIAYYKSRNRELPSQIKPYTFRDSASRPTPKFKFTPPPPPSVITSDPIYTPPISFNMRDLFS